MAFWNAIRTVSLITQVLNINALTLTFFFFFNKLIPLFHLKIFVFTRNYDRWAGRKTRFCSEYISFLKLCLPSRLSKLSKLVFPYKCRAQSVIFFISFGVYIYMYVFLFFFVFVAYVIRIVRSASSCFCFVYM